MSAAASFSAAPDALEELETLIADASGAPAEFSADLLIRIAGSPRFGSAAARRALLDTAFLLAYGAQESHKRAAPPPQVPIDSRAGALTRAYATGLDMLTLQLRATTALVPLDPRRAREMFEWIAFYLPPATCDTMLVPVADEYYATLATIARRTFESGSQIDDEALKFFVLYLWRLSLPSEFPAAIRAIRTLNLPRIEAGYLETVLQSIGEHLERDARGFSTFGVDLVSKTGELADVDRSQGVRGETLMRGLRKLVVAQSSAERCADSVAEGPIAELFNAILRRRELPADIVAPLASGETRPSKVLAGAAPDRYWQSPEARRLVLAFGSLRTAAGRGRGDAIKRTTDWQAQAQSYLVDVELWNGAREPVERDYFDEKGLLYDYYIDLVPAGALRTRAVQSLVAFLRRSRTGRESRTLWFSHVARLLQRRDPATIPAMEASGDAILTMYARAERLLSASR